MSSFTILSETWDDKRKIERDFTISAEQAKMRYFLIERPNMQKDYNGAEQVLLWDIFVHQSYLDYIQQFSHLEPEHRNPYIKIFSEEKKYFKLATSDDSSSNHIVYDFAKEYLAINPDKVLYEEWSEIVITLNDIKKIESEGGYYPGWYDKLSKSV